MAQFTALEGQKVKNIKTGETISALGEQDVEGGKGQFFNSAQYQLQPVEPVASQVPDPNTPITSSELTTAPDQTAIQKNQNQANYITKVQQSFDAVGADAKANDAFIQAVAQAKYGRPASKDELSAVGTTPYGLVGATIGDVIKRFGIEDKMTNFGITPPKGVTQTPATQQETAQTPAEQQASVQQDVVNNLQNIANAQRGISGVVDEARKAEMEAQQVEAKSQAIADANKYAQDLKTAYDKAGLDLQIEDIKDIKEQNIIKAQPILTSQIGGQLQRLSQEQKLDRAIDTLELMKMGVDYNRALVNVNIAQGNYDRAMEIVRETASLTKESQENEIKALQAEGKITEFNYNNVMAEIEKEQARSDEGLVHIKDIGTYQDMILNQGFVEGDFEKDVVTGKIYLKPSQELTLDQALSLGVPQGTTLRDLRQGKVKPVIKATSSGSGGSGGSGSLETVTSGGNGGYVDRNTGKPAKLTATQVDTLSGYDNTLLSAQQALDEINTGDISTGPIAGRLFEAKKIAGFADDKTLKFEQKISKVKAEFMKAISGAAVSEPEVRRLSKFLPDMTDQENVIKSKLETLLVEASRSRDTFMNITNIAQQSESPMSNISTAQSSGYSNAEIIEYLSNDNPEMENKISEAKNLGYSDDEIINFLKQ